MNFVDELIHTLDRHSSRFRFLRYETLKMALCCRMTFVAKTFRKTQKLKLIGWRIVDDRQKVW
jgi:hypothetical protein